MFCRGIVVLLENVPTHDCCDISAHCPSLASTLTSSGLLSSRMTYSTYLRHVGHRLLPLSPCFRSHRHDACSEWPRSGSATGAASVTGSRHITHMKWLHSRSSRLHSWHWTHVDAEVTRSLTLFRRRRNRALRSIWSLFILLCLFFFSLFLDLIYHIKK